MRHVYAIFAITFLLASANSSASEQTINGKIKAVDSAKNSITVEDVVLDVSRKTKITVDGKKATIADIKAGRRATVTYDDTLEAAISIVVGTDAESDHNTSEDVNDKVELLNIEEINSEGSDLSPWLSDDGLTIYWDAKDTSGNGKEDWIWSARRKDPVSLFDDKKKVFRGRFPVVTSDGLEITFRSPDFEGFSVATRNSTSDSFGRPRRITDLKLEKLHARPRSISSDGLSLYFDATKVRNKSDETWVSTRTSRDGNWQTPIPVKIAIPGISKEARFTQVFLTRDGLHLFCTAALPKVKGEEDIHPAVLSREAADGVFTKYQRLSMKKYQSEIDGWRVPRFIEATNEMVVISGGRGADLWLLKNFTPPYLSK